MRPIIKPLALLAFATLSATANPPETVVVKPDTWSETPVSALLYSHFIELGYGIQVEPMWGELLFNRSFERFTPYRNINVSWFDLWNDPKDQGKGYKTDWRGEDWYHSGYEHNPWFPAPGKGGVLPIDDQSTFFILTSPDSSASLAPVKGGSGHGTQCLRVTNNGIKAGAGLAQEGKFLQRGESFEFSGQLRAAVSGQKVQGVEVRLYPEGNWQRPLAAVPLGELGDEFAAKTAMFKNVDFAGRATFALWLPPGADVVADDFSLMPVKSTGGWRPEVVAELKKIRPGVIRFPGGCFASFYDWRDGVGPHSKRPPQASFFWGGMNYNDVGTDEYARMCHELGSEMMMCVNVFHPSKAEYDAWVPHKAKHGAHFPQFTDEKDGAKLAADWVAYCNLPAGTHPMADLRARNGFPKPFGAKFWEMDNETFRWFTPEEYARTVVVYSKAMKAVDPTIQIGLVTYGGDFPKKLREMLDIAGHDVDFLADRGAGPGILGVMRDFNRRNGTRLRCSHTEWLPYNNPPDDFNNIKDGDTSKSWLFSKWAYAMNIFRGHLDWQRAGEDMLFVNFNNLANTHSQCVIDTPKEGVYLTAAGRAFEMLAASPAAWPLRIEGWVPKPSEQVQVQASWDRERKRMVLNLFNMSEKEVTQTFDLTKLGKGFRRATRSTLWAPKLDMMNTMAHPDTIQRDVSDETSASAKTLWQVKGKPYSFTEVVLDP